MASDIGKIETEAQFLAIKDVLMLCNQNKPFYSSMSTRNQSVSSTGKVETTGSTFRQETRCSEALLYVKYIKEYMTRNQNTFCSSRNIRSQYGF